jgi:uncharacterized membrane protein
MLCKPVFVYFDREVDTSIWISRAISRLWVLGMKLLQKIRNYQEEKPGHKETENIPQKLIKLRVRFHGCVYAWLIMALL